MVADTAGKFRHKNIRYYLFLASNSLFLLRNFMEGEVSSSRDLIIFLDCFQTNQKVGSDNFGLVSDGSS